MIKLYDLVFEDIEKNDIDLGDKTQEFNEKLELMPSKPRELLIDFVDKLNDSELKEFKNLINKYSNVKDLGDIKTPLEKKVANLEKDPAGPGEILFHLELQDSSMDVGKQTNHDLIVKGKVWEVKKIVGSEMGVRGERKPSTRFRLAKKGRASQFKFNNNLLEIVILMDKIIENSKIEEEFNDISPRLRQALDQWEDVIIQSKKNTGGNTPKDAILKGDHNSRFRKIMIDIIEIVKDEIKINTNDEFTTVKFGGVGITPKDKGIDPVKIQQVDDDSVLLNFIGRDTLKILERLNEMPYAKEGDFINDIDEAVRESLKDMPSIIIWGEKDGKILIIEKDKFGDYLEFGEVAQGNLIIKVKDEGWSNA